MAMDFKYIIRYSGIGDHLDTRVADADDVQEGLIVDNIVGTVAGCNPKDCLQAKSTFVVYTSTGELINAMLRVLTIPSTVSDMIIQIGCRVVILHRLTVCEGFLL